MQSFKFAASLVLALLVLIAAGPGRADDRADGFALGVTGGGDAPSQVPANPAEFAKLLCDRIDATGRCLDETPRVIRLATAWLASARSSIGRSWLSEPTRAPSAPRMRRRVKRQLVARQSRREAISSPAATARATVLAGPWTASTSSGALGATPSSWLSWRSSASSPVSPQPKSSGPSVPPPAPPAAQEGVGPLGIAAAAIGGAALAVLAVALFGKQLIGAPEPDMSRVASLEAKLDSLGSDIAALRDQSAKSAQTADTSAIDGRLQELYVRLHALLDFLLPQYVAEGKAHMVIAIGCTGGRHRSVAIAEHLAARYGDHDDLDVAVAHRDIDKLPGGS